MNGNTMKFLVRENPWNDSIGVVIGQTTLNGATSLASGLVLMPHVSGSSVVNDTFSMNRSDAQQLCDQLYAVGIRPSAAAGSAGQLEAVKYHLEDMRQLLAKFIGGESK